MPLDDDLEVTQPSSNVGQGKRQPLKIFPVDVPTPDSATVKPPRSKQTSIEEFFESKRVVPVNTPLQEEPTQSKFNWVAFFVMLVSVSLALFIMWLIPGPFDEAMVAIVASAVYGFMNSGYAAKNIQKKK